MDCIASDYWKSYEQIIPKEKHVQSKKETFHGRKIQQNETLYTFN